MKAEKIKTVGYAIVDGFGDLDIATIRDSEKDAIEAWVIRKAEIKGSVAAVAVDGLWHMYAAQWGAQVVPVEIASEGEVVRKQPGFLKLEDLKVKDR